MVNSKSLERGDREWKKKKVDSRGGMRPCNSGI